MVHTKILLKFKTKNNIIPLDYRRSFLSFFKRALSSVADGKYFQKYYSNDKIRPFTFSVELPKPKFSKENIILSKNSIRLKFSTGDSLTGYVFFSAFLAQKDVVFPISSSNTIQLITVTKTDDKSVADNYAVIKMLSPLCIREHFSESNKDKYYSVANSNFNNKFKDIIKEQLLLAGFTEEIIYNIEIEPVNCKKTVIYHYKSYIECSIGKFIIYADSSIINYFLKFGIGSRKSEGFGYIELIT